MIKLNLDKVIEESENGKKKYTIAHHHSFGKIAAYKSRSQYTSGTLTFYYEGEIADIYLINDTKHRQRVMKRILKRCERLYGEKYFLWQPHIRSTRLD